MGGDILQVSQVGGLISDGLEIIDREFNVGGPGHRKKVQNLIWISTRRKGGKAGCTHSVCRTSDDVDDGDCVEEGLASDYIPGSIDVDRTGHSVVRI